MAQQQQQILALHGQIARAIGLDENASGVFGRKLPVHSWKGPVRGDVALEGRAKGFRHAPLEFSGLGMDHQVHADLGEGREVRAIEGFVAMHTELVCGHAPQPPCAEDHTHLVDATGGEIHRVHQIFAGITPDIR